MMWLMELLQRYQIENYSMEECIDLLGSNEIDLSQYLLITTGKNTRESSTHKQVGFFRLTPFYVDGKPLQGKHTIHIYTRTNIVSMMIESLSSVRRQIFGFEDHLSFERSTYLCLGGHHKILRLKCVRGLLLLQQRLCLKLPRDLPLVTSRTRSQFIRNVQQIYTSYLRDYANKKVSKKEILEMLRNDVNMYLDSIMEFIL